MQKTPFESMEGVGARRGPPALLRLLSILELRHNAPAWCAGGPRRAPTPGVKARNLSHMAIRLDESDEHEDPQVCFM